MGGKKIPITVSPRSVMHAGDGMKAQGTVKLGGSFEERIELRRMKRLVADQSRDRYSDQLEFHDGAAHFFDGAGNIVQCDHRRSMNTAFGLGATGGDIVVMGAAN